MKLVGATNVPSLRPRHKRGQSARRDLEEAEGHDGCRPSSATLIITPPSILQQWTDELHRHAPSLRVLHYEGLKKGVGKLEDDDLVDTLSQQDVVLTTYTVLASEVHHAVPLRDRGLRREKKYAPRRSPLIRISWWRVCLDGKVFIVLSVDLYWYSS